MPKFLILSVDDEEITQGLIKEVLSSEHVVSLVSSGETCLKYLENHVPDLILLDVSMPLGMNGFETCRKLKEIESLHNTPVIFVSGQSSEVERLEGYESGGVDYILKPFEIDNLREKVNLNLELARQNSDNTNLERKLTDSNQSAIHALNYSNDLILVIQFYEHCHQFKNNEMVARKILSITTELGLRTVVQIRSNGTTAEYSDFGVVTPLERQVIYENHASGMFYQLHSYLMVNHSNISILIKNMPSKEDNDQEITYEKLQETLRALGFAANSSILKLSQSAKSEKCNQDDDLLDLMILKLQNICESYQDETLEILKQNIDALEQLKQDAQSEQLQQKIVNLIEATIKKSKKINDNKFDVGQIKEEIGDLLEIISDD
ncbi:hypothetical protein MNBD_GAMMA22-178 [hydrothermal vent metagenome]|uniref:Response regulatory domain-containing protein n=1 Tax=hydrothermal vent metagenome TaxID=652676 RepID=A0A3B1APH2_9ZZZZ